MAMADRRPLGIPVASAHAAPAFNSPQKKKAGLKQGTFDMKGVYTKNDVSSYTGELSPSPTDLSPNSRSISPDSLMNSGSLSVKKGASSNSSRDSTPPLGPSHEGLQLSETASYEKAELSIGTFEKKHKPAARTPIATGISTTIPVTGEKPKPEQDGDASLADDVLFAIFLILYEKDTKGQGMTVKQICDVLIERHPEMAQLLSKTSNLVSAKLNAYVKRVEKGDSNLKYALSREWADASPKRMVYVYRGLLAKDFHEHVKHVPDHQKQRSPSFLIDSFESAKQLALLKPRHQTMLDLRITRHSFSDTSESPSNLFVPYSTAPVAANIAKLHGAPAESAGDARGKNMYMGDTSGLADAAGKLMMVKIPAQKFSNDSDFDFDDLEVFNDTDDDDIDHGLAGAALDLMRKAGKRSKSMSHFSPNKKAKFVTAAAAAPRVPRTPCSHSPHAAAAAAALHAAALKAIAAATLKPSSKGLASAYTTTGAGNLSPKSKSNWAHAVRSGFLTQEIGSPEDVSLSDLDKLFG